MMNDLWKLNNLTSLQLELTSSCQASCPGCARPYDFSSHIENTKNVNSWTISHFKDFIPRSLIQSLREIFICGNYGDPLLCQDLEKILEYTLNVNPNIFICIHTNGGAGDTIKWSNLAKVLKGRNHIIKFSIDGLEDTNSLYRRGVKWNKIVENADSFISNKGRAVWKFIKFPHNEHQIEEAKNLSKRMGFKRFEEKKHMTTILILIIFPTPKT